MKRVLLTGAGGFVGSHTLIHFLHNTDWELILLDSFRHKGKTDRIVEQIDISHPEYFPRVSVITHDLNAPISKQMARRIGPIDYLVNMASESHVDRSIDEPRDFIENNINVVLTMLEYIRKYPVEKFIQISTDEVYGPAPEGVFFTEGDRHRPSNPYAASKAAQEDICYSYWRTFNLPIIITNTMNMIGELQDPEKFIPMVIKRVLNDEMVDVHASEDGVPGTRFYLHARNMADALMFILTNIPAQRYKDGHDLERFHIVGEREMDNLAMAQLIATYLDKELRYQMVDFHSSRPGHDLRYAMDGSKLRNAGWNPPLSLEESLKNTVEWTKEHPEWLE